MDSSETQRTQWEDSEFWQWGMTAMKLKTRGELDSKETMRNIKKYEVLNNDNMMAENAAWICWIMVNRLCQITQESTWKPTSPYVREPVHNSNVWRCSIREFCVTNVDTGKCSSTISFDTIGMLLKPEARRGREYEYNVETGVLNNDSLWQHWNSSKAHAWMHV